MSMEPPANLALTTPLPAPALESTPLPIPDVVETGSNLTAVSREPSRLAAATNILETGAQYKAPILVGAISERQLDNRNIPLTKLQMCFELCYLLDRRAVWYHIFQ